MIMNIIQEDFQVTKPIPNTTVKVLISLTLSLYTY